jgi:acetolactate synthase-1/2/3 large subunit
MTNALTGLGDALLDGSAMVMIAGDAPNYFSGQEAFQELSNIGEAEQISVARPLVKRAWRVTHRAALIPNLIEAIRIATTGNPGPVLLSVPLNFFSEVREEEIPDVRQRMPTDSVSTPRKATIDDALKLLEGASNPVIIAGGGAVNAEAQVALTEFAHTLGIPVVTTLSGCGVIAQDDDHHAGFISTVGTPAAHKLVNGADVALVLGSRLGEMETSSWDREISLNSDRTKIIQVDIDPRQVGRFYPVQLGIVANVRGFLDEANATLRSSVRTPSKARIDRIAEIKGQVAEWKNEIRRTSNWNGSPIAVERLLAEIRGVLPKDGIFLTDVGIRHMVAQQFETYHPSRLYIGSGWGTMGGAVAAALGAKLACPDVPVIAEVGDGAFTSIMGSVVTAVEHEIPVVWVVMNNFGYSSISVYQAKHGLGKTGTSFREGGGSSYSPDYAAFGIACGAGGATVREADELRPALEKALSSGRPYVLDVYTELEPRFRATGRWDVNDLLAGLKSPHS